jgi:hypothetical protein
VFVILYSAADGEEANRRRVPWVASTPSRPPELTYRNGIDGFDVYIDGARYLPANVTITRVTCEAFIKSFDQRIAPPNWETCDVNGSAISPVFHVCLCCTLRSPHISYLILISLFR